LSEPLEDLGRFVLALDTYRDEAVLAGGMVPVIYRHLKTTSAAGYAPLTTFDLDFALPGRLGGEQATGLTALLRDADFVEHLRGSTDPPVSVYQHVRHGEELGPIHVELLAPLTGAGMRKGGASKTLVEVQEGLKAQAIRYLDLLFEQPLIVNCSDVPSLGLARSDISFRIPHPAMYVLQKVLCRETRRGAKREKDLAYIFDVVVLFRDRWSEVGDVARTVADANPTFTQWIERSRKDLARLFSSPTAEGPVSAHRVYAAASGSSAPEEEAIYRVVSRFIEESGLG